MRQRFVPFDGAVRFSLLLVLCFFGGMQRVSCAGIPAFSKLLAFAGTNQVRISAVLEGASAGGDVAINATIKEAASGKLLWEGSLGSGQSSGSASTSISNLVTGLNPKLWSIVSPNLYYLTLTAAQSGKAITERSVRIGFRTFDIKDGQFRLNGEPVFLRGVAINPPGRGIPKAVGESRKFAEDYVRFLKSRNLNIFRLSVDESQVWFDVCDELGMMLYAGHYGAPIASDGSARAEVSNDAEDESSKKSPPKDFERSIAGYEKLFEGFASHPSIVEYYLSNELPHSGPRGAAFSKYLERACEALKKWDSTRPYIGNAGYGEGREGDVCDVHRYWGWYYNSFLTYYNLRDRLHPKPLFGDPAKNQPLTFTECVGSFTGSSGEINVIRSKQLAPRLGWVGHTDSPREDALEYQSFMTGEACESFRRMRPLNPRLAGLMPFTILFYNWSGISSFAEMQPKPVMDAMRLAYQPVLLSWEMWTPQVYAGKPLAAVAHVINDDDANRPLIGAKLHLAIRSASGKEFCAQDIDVPNIRHFDTWKRRIAFDLPADMATGDYTVTGCVMDGKTMRSTNGAPLFIAGKNWAASSPAPTSSVLLVDPSGETAKALSNNQLKFKTVTDLPPLDPGTSTLLIGEHAWNSMLSAAKDRLRQFVKSGGRILCLAQDGTKFDRDWLPQSVGYFTSSPNDTDYPPRSRPFREQMNVNPERLDHPVFAGLTRKRFSLWSDYSGWDQTKPGFPKVYPVGNGFKLTNPEALRHTAVLADYDRGLEGIALCEMFEGEGSVILSGFDIVSRSGLDPVADKLLRNLVSYVASTKVHEPYPLVESPIIWGNFPTERGVVNGSMNGLLVNTEWIPAPHGPASKPLAPNTGAWNMLPGDQFVPVGRSPFGEFGYSTASSLKIPDPEATKGSGYFCARFPAGRKAILTVVKNPGDKDAHLSVDVNAGESKTEPHPVPANQTVRIRTPLNNDVTSACIRYTGDRSLVLLETSFE